MIESVYTDETTEISHLPGTSGTAVISFTGIGMGLGAVQVEEFRQSLSGTPNDVFFVKDKTRHWYNETFHLIAETLNAKLRLLQIRETITLGNSMGGFGAIAFAGQLHACRRAIAFASQSAVDPSIVPWERRYDQWFKSISQWNGLDALKLLHPEVHYFSFFGHDEKIDLRHAMRFIDANWPTMSVCIFEGCGHDVSLFLKQRAILVPLIKNLTSDSQECRVWKGLLEKVPHAIFGNKTPGCRNS